MQLNLALDWTPNTNHSGFYLALHEGFYEKEGITLLIGTPAEDNYTVTPAKKLELGKADLAIAPMESVIAYRTKAKPFAVKAIAAILQEDLSSICVLKSSNIHSPKDLDGKIYASYKARYEDAIVREMMRNDQGKGELVVAYPEKLGIWNTLLSGEADATWIFRNWEGLEAKAKGVELRHFVMADYGIPYSYSPVIIAGEASIAQNPDVLRAFLKASRKGFAFAQQQPQLAVRYLREAMGKSVHFSGDLLESQEFTNPHYGVGASWGHMDEGRVQVFLDWLHSKGLESRHFKAGEVVTNGLR